MTTLTGTNSSIPSLHFFIQTVLERTPAVLLILSLTRFGKIEYTVQYNILSKNLQKLIGTLIIILVNFYNYWLTNKEFACTVLFVKVII